MKLRKSLQVTLAVLILFTNSVGGFGQSGFQATRIKPEEPMRFAFHRAVLKNGKPQWDPKSSGQRFVVGPALSNEEVEAGFKQDDVVVLRVKADYDHYLYVVNVSQWEGVNLMYPLEANENVLQKAGQEKDYAFQLTNKPGKPAAGREDFLVMASKIKVDNPELTRVLESDRKEIVLEKGAEAEGRKKLESELTEKTKPTTTPTSVNSKAGESKWLKVISVGCNAAGIFIPFAKLACGSLGFSATRVTPDNALSPEGDTDRLIFRLSMPVKADLGEKPKVASATK